MAARPRGILPDPTLVQLDAITVEEEHGAITLVRSATVRTAVCPLCSRESARIHRRYVRTLADLAWADVPVRRLLGVRRFLCDTSDCTRRIVRERLPTIARPWARRTTRLAATQQQLGLIAGGSAGSVLCTTLAYPSSRDMLLRLLRQSTPQHQPTPRVLGVDDWAMRKGQWYGTILIDHERSQVVDLLPDRTPQTLAQWLREHPGVEVVTRDRAEAYVQGITQGAPNARQVADRWHLLKNLTDTLTLILQNHRRAIEQYLLEPKKQEAPNVSLPQGAHLSQTEQVVPLPTAAEQQRQAPGEQPHHLHTLGWSKKQIATHLDCHPKTIQRVLKRQLPLPVGRSARPRTLDPYMPYLIKRWNEGCHNAAQLHREIQTQGFVGGCTVLRIRVAELRRASGVPACSRKGKGGRLSAAPKRVLSSHTLAWLSTQPAAALDKEQQMLRTTLMQVNTTRTTAVERAQTFSTLVRERQAALRDRWLDQATTANIPALWSFANGMRADLAAVRAALSEIWSNGRTEGNVNRLKCGLKCVRRQMYGRGKLDVLRSRLIGFRTTQT